MFTARILPLLLAVSLLATAQEGRKGNAEALFDKGMNAISGSGPTRSALNAATYFRSSADLGYSPAQVMLGYMEETGVAMGSTSAAEWYRKAAEQGDELGQWLLGRLYYTGNGVVRDLNEAERWLSGPARQGNAFAQYLLGLVYKDRDYQRAPEWLLKAAEQGLPQAQYEYAMALLEGRGVSQDKFQAYVWLVRSSQPSNANATFRMGELEGYLGTAKVEEAKQQALKMPNRVLRSTSSQGCSGWRGEFSSIPTPPPPELHQFCR